MPILRFECGIGINWVDHPPNYDHLLSQMTLILIILKYGAACDHLESNVESITCIFNFNFGHKVANSGQPELLAAKIFQVPRGSRCLRRVCDQAELSAMCGS